MENMRRDARHAPPPAGTLTRVSWGTALGLVEGRALRMRVTTRVHPGSRLPSARTPLGPACGRLYKFAARGGEMRAGARGHRFLSFSRVARVPLGSGRGAIRVYLSRTQLRLVLAGGVGFGYSVRFLTWIHRAPRSLPQPTRPQAPSVTRDAPRNHGEAEPSGPGCTHPPPSNTHNTVGRQGVHCAPHSDPTSGGKQVLPQDSLFPDPKQHDSSAV